MELLQLYLSTVCVDRQKKTTFEKKYFLRRPSQKDRCRHYSGDVLCRAAPDVAKQPLQAPL